MSIERTKSKQKVKEPKTKITWKEIKRQKVLLFWAAIMVVYGVVFYYLPLAGWTMAFQNYKPRLGIFHSQFVGWDKFRTLFSDMTFIRVIRNTLAMGVINLVVTFITAIVFAILLNEIHKKWWKKTVQTLSYLPHFISLVVVCGMVKELLTAGGPINKLLSAVGIGKIAFMSEPGWFDFVYIASGVWQALGWGTILYLTAMTGINTELYEAASMDGANRFQQIIHVTIPGILPTIMTLLIMDIGGIVTSSNMQKILLLYNPLNQEKADIIGTLVYRMGITGGNFSYAAAVGLFEGLIGLILVSIANFLSKKLTETSLW